jgi:restriction endonuclease Mrr
MAYNQRPFDLAVGSVDPGCFGLKEGRNIDRSTMQMLPITDYRERANGRAAAGHAIARLVTRGLVESCSRGTWRLTASGVKVAKKLWPLVKPMTKRQLAPTIAFREAVHSVVPRRRRRSRPRVRQAEESGIEVPFDF